ncbi:MAG: Holliday junction branch migration protein RuvA [Actinomycetota bacterium]|nr:Holliday junction branch migration protein RuvA [Actinomycetota bacterium]
MIALLSGTVRATGGTRTLIVQAGGVGYLVSVPLSLAMTAKEGQQIELFCVTVVREDSISIYGFESLAERNLFEVLIGVRMVGPALALVIVSMMDADSLIEAVEAKDVAMLTRVPGIGEKTATRILVELSSKLSSIRALAGTADGAQRSTGDSGVRREVEAALTSLGFDAREIRRAMAALQPGQDVSQAVRAALAELRS